MRSSFLIAVAAQCDEPATLYNNWSTVIKYYVRYVTHVSDECYNIFHYIFRAQRSLPTLETCESSDTEHEKVFRRENLPTHQSEMKILFMLFHRNINNDARN